jgi:uncharacterized protein YjbI with pentapeptide repeats
MKNFTLEKLLFNSNPNSIELEGIKLNKFFSTFLNNIDINVENLEDDYMKKISDYDINIKVNTNQQYIKLSNPKEVLIKSIRESNIQFKYAIKTVDIIDDDIGKRLFDINTIDGTGYDFSYLDLSSKSIKLHNGKRHNFSYCNLRYANLYFHTALFISADIRFTNFNNIKFCSDHYPIFRYPVYDNETLDTIKPKYRNYIKDEGFGSL